ncbi:Protein of unknown function (DUF1616) [Thaumarchaeota archaeon SCGC AB-539-E09]|nr:Protein of unknown function (DUF1616) [Thaumarchaeota archaeon SCGC AB-539-E09]
MVVKNMDEKDQDVKIYEMIINTIIEKKIESVETLVTIMEEKSSYSKVEIIDAVILLKDEDKISLSLEGDTEKPRFLTFIFSETSYWYWGIVVVSIMSLFVTHFISENNYPMIYIRYVFGFIFVIFIPGYSLVRLTYLNYKLPYLTQILYSVCLSIFIVMIIGLVLNFTNYGLQQKIIIYAILGISFSLSLITLIRSFLRPYN